MKILTFLSIAVVFIAFKANSQNLYTLPNAANITNEVNATTGWSGPANVASVTTNPQNGTYCIQITTNANGNRYSQFSFAATVGTVYNISIWARRGSNNSNSAFSNWVGFSGFTETSITSQNWQVFNFTVTATSANPQIRVYAATGGPAGRTAFVDAITITAQAGDTQPPTAPSNLTASNTTATGTTLSWNASTDNVGVTGYQIRRNNTTIGTVTGTTLTYNVTGLSASTTYNFNVVAVDAANNVSAASNTVQVTTLSGNDNQPPSAPSNLTASNTTSSSTTLNWNASNDNVGVTGYQVLQNNTMIGSVNGTTLTYNVVGLSPSTSYNYNVVALDAANNVSQPSNTVSVTTLSSGGGGSTPYTSNNANLPTVNWQAANLYVSGAMGIGTNPPNPNNYRLSVNGDIRGKELIVESGWSDFVFSPEYRLLTLKEVEEYIIENGHLKDIPPASVVQKDGIGLAEMNMRLLQKVEELTLYIIELNKQLTELEKAQVDARY